jgi:regulator of RNase E activity RraA
MTDSIPRTELCDRYADLYPGAVTDVLDDRGYDDQTLDVAIDPVDDQMTTAGIAYPCVGRPNRGVDEEANVRNILRMLGDAPEDGVLMYETNGRGAAHIGELSVECLLARGCRGAVLDGGARDLGHILQHDFPLFTRYRTPADAVPRWELLDWDTTAVVGGVAVSPGDVVVGDVDGVCVVPEAVAEDVLRAAEDLANTEDRVREAVRDGVDPVDAYEEYGVF